MEYFIIHEPKDKDFADNIPSLQKQLLKYLYSIGYNQSFFDNNGVLFVNGVVFTCTFGKSYIFISNDKWFTKPLKTQIKYNTKLSKRKYENRIKWIYGLTLYKQMITTDDYKKLEYHSNLYGAISTMSKWGIHDLESVYNGVVFRFVVDQFLVEMLIKSSSLDYEIYVIEKYDTIFNNPITNYSDFSMIESSIYKLKKTVLILHNGIKQRYNEYISKHTVSYEAEPISY